MEEKMVATVESVKPQPTGPAPATSTTLATPVAPAAVPPAVTPAAPSHLHTSEQIDKIAEALAAAQGEIQNALTNSENPHFGSSYADLGAVWSACRGPLSSHGIAVMQIPCWRVPGGMVLITKFVHKSGQWIQGEFPIKPAKEDSQGYGSCLTYAKRYSLSSMAGVATEDDDGNAASGKIPQSAREKEKAEIRKEMAAASKPGEQKASKDEDLSGEWVASFSPVDTASRTLASGKVWYSVKDPDGAVYETDKKELALIAKDARTKGTKISVTYTKKRYKDKIDRNISRIEIDGAQPAPDEAAPAA